MLDGLTKDLMNLGMTAYEATAYAALVGLGEASARQVHEASGVPRPRVYDVLEALEKKGYVEVWHGSPMLYRAVDPDRLINSLREGLERSIQDASKKLKSLSYETKKKTFPVWHMKGEWSIRNAITEMMAGSRQDVLVLCTRLSMLRSLVQQINEVSKEVDVICIVPEGAEVFGEVMGNARVTAPSFGQDSLSVTYRALFQGKLKASDETYRIEIIMVVDNIRSILVYESGGERVAMVCTLPIITALQSSALMKLAGVDGPCPP